MSELQRAVIFGPEPIGEARVPLGPGVTVLYGLNGVGKSRLLAAMAELLNPSLDSVGPDEPGVASLTSHLVIEGVSLMEIGKLLDARRPTTPEEAREAARRRNRPSRTNPTPEEVFVRIAQLGGEISVDPDQVVSGEGTGQLLLFSHASGWDAWLGLNLGSDEFDSSSSRAEPLIRVGWLQGIWSNMVPTLVMPSEDPTNADDALNGLVNTLLGTLSSSDAQDIANPDRPDEDDDWLDRTTLCVRPVIEPDLTRLVTACNESITLLLGEFAPVLSYRILFEMGQPTSVARLHWQATDHWTGSLVELNELSRSQKRWVSVVIDTETNRYDRWSDAPSSGLLGGRRSSIAIIDEPESGLHRNAIRRVADHMAVFSDRVVVATHAAELIDGDFRLVHVSRSGEHSDGKILTSPLNAWDFLTADPAQHGLRRSDILQLTRLFLLVEGPHDTAIVGGWFKDLLVECMAESVELGGTFSLDELLPDSALHSDPQGVKILFTSTDAQYLLLFDRIDETQSAEAFWRNIDRGNRGFRHAYVDGKRKELEHTLGYVPKTWDSLLGLAHRAIDHEQSHRIDVFEWSKKDIAEYLDVRRIIPGYNNWDEVRAACRASIGRDPWEGDLKEWVNRRTKGNYKTPFLHKAAREQGRPLPEDLEEWDRLKARIRRSAQNPLRQ